MSLIPTEEEKNLFPIIGKHQEKIKEIIKFRDDQQNQLNEDLSRLSIMDRVKNAAVIEGIQGIIKGLNYAIQILNKK